MDVKFIWKFYKEKFKQLDKEIALQAKEYKRRLKILNGEAERLRQMQATYTPRELFETKIKEIEEKIELLVAWKLKQEGKNQLIQFIPWILTAVSLWLLYSKK